MTATEIAAVFNAGSKLWRAKATRGQNIESVLFTQANGIVALQYWPETGQFTVKFNKFQAAWGDYIKAISRSLYVVLNTLKAGGAPFEAPASPVGMVIESEASPTGNVIVRWQGGGSATEEEGLNVAEENSAISS